jgi:hypothetical protein
VVLKDIFFFFFFPRVAVHRWVKFRISFDRWMFTTLLSMMLETLHVVFIDVIQKQANIE